jgi:quinohemoprotein ethanol dehydrogenase
VYRHAPAIVFPTEAGAHNWQPMAFSPKTGLVYIPAREQGMVIVNEPFYRWTPGSLNMGAKAIFGASIELLPAAERAQLDALLRSRTELPPLATREFLIAYDPVAQAERWRVPVGNEEFAGGGVLATAGNLVVQGTSSGRLVVRRADTGHELASLEVGTAIMAAPVSYEIDGVQYVAVIAGLGGAVASSYPRESAAWKYENYGRLLAFKLDGGPTPLPKLHGPRVTPEPPSLAGYSAAAAERGAKLFGAQCAHCHGGRGDERLSAYPDLFRLSAETHASFDAIVRGGTLASAGMASFADVVSEADVASIQAFLVREQAALRAAEQSR